MHTARFWMALAIPGGAPGYDDDKELGNFITHMTARTSRRLRKHSRQTLKVKARGNDALVWSLAGFRTFGESKFNVCSHAPSQAPVMAGLVPAIHVFGPNGSKTWMPGTSPGMTT